SAALASPPGTDAPLVFRLPPPELPLPPPPPKEPILKPGALFELPAGEFAFRGSLCGRLRLATFTDGAIVDVAVSVLLPPPNPNPPLAGLDSESLLVSISGLVAVATVESVFMADAVGSCGWSCCWGICGIEGICGMLLAFLSSWFAFFCASAASLSAAWAF